MGEIEVEGPAALELCRRLLSNDVARLGVGESQYTLLTNDARRDHRRPDRQPDGRLPLPPRRQRRQPRRRLRLARRARASRLRRPRRLGRVRAPRRAGAARARAARPRAAPGLHLGRWPSSTGSRRWSSYTGYTGEEGVELACAPEDAPALWDAILARGVTPCGLGARDTLRLEVCYPLHGNDIGPEHDAISSGLGWVCALDKEFSGVARLREVASDGPESRARRVPS